MAKISRSSFTRQYEHVGVIAHGAHPEYRLEFTADVKADDANVSKIWQGSVVSIDATTGKFVAGCGKGTGVNYPVPMISMKNVVDPDVTTGIGDVATDYKKATLSAVGGKIVAIPCTGGYEIETTEFTAQTGATFKPGDALIPDTTNVGKIKIATAQPFAASSASDPIVGFVSRAEYVASNYNHTRLSFFTSFIPAAH